MYEEASVDDLMTIFSDTVIRYQKKPVYVTGVSPMKNLLIIDLEDMKKKEQKEVSLSDPAFDFSPVPLGFCNHNNDAVFLQRIPKRQYKQGLSKNSLFVKEITDDVSVESLSTLKQAKGRSLAHCINGTYPSFTTVIKHILKGACRSMAFSRNLAVDSDGTLFYNDTEIGMVDLETQKIVLKRTAKHMERIVYACTSAPTPAG